MDDGGGPKAPMPVGSQSRPAPECESRSQQGMGSLDSEGEVIDKHRWNRLVLRLQSLQRGRDASLAPRLSTGVRIRVQEELVITDDTRLESSTQSLLASRSAAPTERVVVKKKHRDDANRTVGSTPHWVRVLGRYDAQLSAKPNKMQVSALTTQMIRVIRIAVQFMIPRNPNDLRESLFEAP